MSLLILCYDLHIAYSSILTGTRLFSHRCLYHYILNIDILGTNVLTCVLDVENNYSILFNARYIGTVQHLL